MILFPIVPFRDSSASAPQPSPQLPAGLMGKKAPVVSNNLHGTGTLCLHRCSSCFSFQSWGVEESVASVCAFNTDRSAYLLQDLRVFTISVDKPKIGQEKSGFDLSWLDVMTNL